MNEFHHNIQIFNIKMIYNYYMDILLEEFQHHLAKPHQPNYPLAFRPCRPHSHFDLQEYFKVNSTFLLSKLQQVGALLFKGFNIKSGCQLVSVTNHLGFKPYVYKVGSAVRKVIVGDNFGKGCGLMTTNQAPREQFIPPHNQLAQTTQFVSHLVFYCLNKECQGGSTPISNCPKIYEQLSKKHKDLLKKIERGVIYTRVIQKQSNSNSSTGRGWMQMFGVKSKEQFQENINKTIWDYTWNDDELILKTKVLPAVRKLKDGRMTFFNQIVAAYRGWYKTAQKIRKAVVTADGEEFQQAQIKILQEIIKQNEFVIDWQAGDFLIINNQISLHWRQPFGPGQRIILAQIASGLSQVDLPIHHVLQNGSIMPAVGFGCWQIDKKVCEDVVYTALKNGYQLIDSAQDYANQQQVGRGIQRALKDGIIQRSKLFITSKLWNTFHKPQHVRPALLRTLKDLKLDYLDLFLIHFPISLEYVDPQMRYPPGWFVDPNIKNPRCKQVKLPLIDTWREMQKLYDQGLVRNIGISNFNCSLLRDFLSQVKITPTVNQVQMHPFLPQDSLLNFCVSRNISITAYSSLGGKSYAVFGANSLDFLPQNQIINVIAKSIKKTGAQVCLRWAFQRGIAVIPKSLSQERQIQNLRILGWCIGKAAVEQIKKLNCGRRMNDVGKAFNLPIYD